jgi:hypothetical protein
MLEATCIAVRSKAGMCNKQLDAHVHISHVCRHTIYLMYVDIPYISCM